MDIRILSRGLAYVALAGALLAAAIALNNRQYPTTAASKTEPSTTPGALVAELAHCKAIGAKAANDAVCKAVWEANRERFFESKKLYQDRLTDVVPATPDLNEPAVPLGRDLPRSAPQWPSTHNSGALRPPGDTAGQPK
jgi:conjugative transfer region protein TrbK